MSVLNSIIVEDEISSQKNLNNLILDFCEGVTVDGFAGTVDEAVKLILQKKPDIVFLDIELPGKNGFHILDYFPSPSFDIIFTTAYNQYAIKALKLSAIDYLLKPIDLEELRLAIQKVTQKRQSKADQQKYQLLKENLNNSFNKLTLPCSTGYVFAEIEQVVRCEAQGNYTQFFMLNGDKHLVSKTLGVYEELLSEMNFCRINRKDLININQVVEFRRQKKAMVKMSDGSLLHITNSRKDDFLKLINNS